MKSLTLLCLITYIASTVYGDFNCSKNAIWCSEPAREEDYPFFINFDFHYAGILIEDRWIMTVAHGWNPGNTEVHLAGADYKVLALFTLYGHDTVLVYLDRPVQGFTPIAWNTTQDNCDYLKEEKIPIRIVGAGIDTTEKEEFTVGQADLYMQGRLWQTPTLIILANDKQQHILDGDSGSPAFIYKDGTPLLIGMTTSSAANYALSFSTCISYQKEWMTKMMKKAKAMNP